MRSTAPIVRTHGQACFCSHRDACISLPESGSSSKWEFMRSLFQTGMLLSMMLIGASGVSGVAKAQSHLDRITTVPRADGLGYVTRFHFDAAVDSFKMVQSSDSLIQILFYAPGVSGPAVDQREQHGPSHLIETFSIAIGLGADIRLSTPQSHFARIYFDKNGTDVLVSQERMDPEDLQLLTEGIPTIPWSVYREATRSAATGDAQAASGSSDAAQSGPYGNGDEAYGGVLDNLKFDVVVIDAGHGGDDPGSIGPKGIREKDITLKVAKKLGGYIEQYLPDVKVVYTRDRDIYVDLEERGSIGNRARGDLFVSIHTNSYKNREITGTEVYFLGLARSESALEVMKRENSVVRFEGPGAKAELSEEDLLIYELANSGYITISQQIAGMIDHQFTQRASRASRGVKQAGFMVLYHASMPALLIELGFISNEQEARFLASEYGQDILASAIFRAIRDYKQDVDKKLHIPVR